MHDQHPDDFTEQLLSQEKLFSDSRYEEYRQRLDERLQQERHRPRLRRRLPFALLVAAAAAVLIAAYVIWTRQPANVVPDPGSHGGPALIVLRPAPDDKPGFPRPPFDLETRADVIALATTADTLEHAGEKLVRLNVERPLKGRFGPGQVGAPEPPPSLCCSPAGDLQRKGTRVLLFLAATIPAGWNILDIQPLSAEQEGRRVAEVQARPRAQASGGESEACNHVCALPGPLPGRLDLVTCQVLTAHPDPRAADALVARLGEARDQLCQSEQPTGPPPATREQIETLHRLAQALAPLHEARAVRPLLECAARLPRGSSGPLYTALPNLCRSADAATVKAARGTLADTLRTPPSGDDDYRCAAAALARLADREALDLLLAEQARLPLTAANGQVVVALRDGRATLGPADHARVAESWLALLREHLPGDAPSDLRRDFVRSVAQALHTAGPPFAERLRTLAQGQASPWFDEEIKRLHAR